MRMPCFQDGYDGMMEVVVGQDLDFELHAKYRCYWRSLVRDGGNLSYG